MNPFRALCVFAVTAIVSSAATTAATARAAWWRSTVNSCSPQDGRLFSWTGFSWTLGNMGGGLIMCGVPDNTTNSKFATTSLYVNATTGSAINNFAQTCTISGIGSVSCGPSVIVTGGSAAPSYATWISHPYDYATIVVILNNFGDRLYGVGGND